MGILELDRRTLLRLFGLGSATFSAGYFAGKFEWLRWLFPDDGGEAKNLPWQYGNLVIAEPAVGSEFRLGIDISTPVRKDIIQLMSDTLQDMGGERGPYTLTLHGRTIITDEFVLPGDPEPGRRIAGCFFFGWSFNHDQRTIDVFLYRDPAKASRPDLPCDAGQCSGVVRNAISAAKGDSSWFANGASEIMRRYGLEVLTAEHMPIGAFFPQYLPTIIKMSDPTFPE